MIQIVPNNLASVKRLQIFRLDTGLGGVMTPQTPGINVSVRSYWLQDIVV